MSIKEIVSESSLISEEQIPFLAMIEAESQGLAVELYEHSDGVSGYAVDSEALSHWVASYEGEVVLDTDEDGNLFIVLPDNDEWMVQVDQLDDAFIFEYEGTAHYFVNPAPVSIGRNF